MDGINLRLVMTTCWKQQNLSRSRRCCSTFLTGAQPTPTSHSRRRKRTYLSFSSSSAPLPPSSDYDGPKDGGINEGVVEGVWMFCRHGDRTPSRPLTPEHRQMEEAAYWMTKLPFPDSATIFTSFSQYYPVKKLKAEVVPGSKNSSVNNVACPDTFIDVARNPFGFLTAKGLQQLQRKGQECFQRYNTYAYHLPECRDWQSATDFLSVWNVRVYSTNYLRTIMSVQSFLDGMFSTKCYQPILHPNGSPQDRILDPNITKEERIPCTQQKNEDRSIPNTQPASSSSSSPLVTIKVRALRHDPLNAFDRNPDLIAELVTEVTTAADFFQRDGEAAPLAARLANILPGLVRRRHNDNATATNNSSSSTSTNNKTTSTNNKTTHSFSRGTPSGINWVEAADHFVCRAAHKVSLSKFSDFETDEVEQTLLAMSHPTMAHLSWRFRQWYQHDRLLAVIAAPPLREITDQIVATPLLTVHDRRPFVIYSCHDITILGLLYAIGADFLAEGGAPSPIGSMGSSGWRFWPPYGCHLVFELVRVREGPPSPESHRVRVLLNGTPVRSVHAPHNEQLGGHMLRVDDFARIVTKLEQAGGHDYASLLARG